MSLPGKPTIASLFVAVGCVVTAAHAAPRIECDPSEFDFGTAANTGSVQRTFMIWNRGDSLLEIKRVVGCCGAKTKLASKRIKPGTNTQFFVTISLKGRNSEVRKSIYLVSNDPERRYCGIRITGKAQAVKPPAETPPKPAVTSVPTIEDPVVIDYFFEAGCPACAKVDGEVLPALKRELAGLYRVNRRDLFHKTNVVRLVEYQEAFGIEENESVCMVVDARGFLNGLDAIRDKIAPLVRDCLAAGRASEQDPAGPAAAGATEAAADASLILERRVRNFTVAAVLMGGLVDGVNPCAIGTLVFLISMLAVSKVRKWRLLVTGSAYCLASFITYTAIGLGLLHVLHSFDGFPTVQRVVEAVLVAMLSVLALLSFVDAVRYGAAHDAGKVMLQLPDKVKMRIHALVRGGAKALRRDGTKGGGVGALLAVGFGLGVVVTALESVCTGQVYVPTLAMVARAAKAESARAWALLLGYNTMFVIPLVGAFLLTHIGLSTQALADFSKRNVVAAKLLLGAFFILMALLIVTTA